MITFTIVKRVLLKENVKNTTLNAFYLKTTAKWYKNSFGGGFFWGIIAPRPAGPYPDISLAGKNPMSVALTERHHKSQDNYLLGKKEGRGLRYSGFSAHSMHGEWFLRMITQKQRLESLETFGSPVSNGNTRFLIHKSVSNQMSETLPACPFLATSTRKSI